MADNAETSSDAQITFKVKTASDSTHTITMADSQTVLDLKTKLAGADLENIPVERQRLIYSGRVMKNDDALSTYKIKLNNTVHMVKSAASNPSQPAPTSSASTPQAVPTNMASGTANNPLAGLTGARYAGHQINMPGLEMFGPDGGMGPPMDEERMQRLMNDPNIQQSMNEALNNPDFINMLIESNPMLRNIPNAREIITSPFMRQMMSNPQMMTQAMRMQRNMRGGEAAFPAPGATDNTPEGATTGRDTFGSEQNPPAAAPMQNMTGWPQAGFLGGLQGGDGQPSPAQLQQQLQQILALQESMGLNTNAAANPGQAATAQTGLGATGAQGTTPGGGAQQGISNPPPANPFAPLFDPAGGEPPGPGNNYGATPEMLQHMIEILSTAGPGGAPADNRPPEERYAEQLRQLNDMGFFDFDRNVAALRRSGGSVQGAIEHLLSN